MSFLILSTFVISSCGGHKTEEAATVTTDSLSVVVDTTATDTLAVTKDTIVK